MGSVRELAVVGALIGSLVERYIFGNCGYGSPYLSLASTCWGGAINVAGVDATTIQSYFSCLSVCKRLALARTIKNCS